MRIKLHHSAALTGNRPLQELAVVVESAISDSHETELDAEHPELIHVLGTGDAATTRCIRHALRRRIPVLVSPLGTLQPWQHAASSALPVAPEQLKSCAAAIHVCSEIEQKNLVERLRAADCEAAFALYPNPIVTTATTVGQFSHDILGLYEQLFRRHDEAINREIAAKVSGISEPDQSICAILRLTLYARYQHQQGVIARQTLRRLTETLTTSDYDEAHFADCLNQAGLTTFFAQLEHLMQQHDTLTEGFMPIPAKPAGKHFQIL